MCIILLKVCRLHHSRGRLRHQEIRLTPSGPHNLLIAMIHYRHSPHAATRRPSDGVAFPRRCQKLPGFPGLPYSKRVRRLSRSEGEHDSSQGMGSAAEALAGAGAKSDERYQSHLLMVSGTVMSNLINQSIQDALPCDSALDRTRLALTLVHRNISLSFIVFLEIMQKPSVS